MFNINILSNKEKTYEEICKKYKIKHMYKPSIYFEEPGTTYYDEMMKDYEKVLKIFKRKCNQFNINYENDEDKIIFDVVKKLDEEVDEDFPEYKNDLSYCYNIDKIKEKMEELGKDANTEAELQQCAYKLQSTSEDLIKYVSNFFHITEKATIALTSNNQEDKEIIKSYTEFLIAMPKYTKIIKYLQLYSEKFIIKRQEVRREKFINNKEFISNLEILIEHDSKLDEYLYHAAQTQTDAKKIIENGLYMFSDELESTTYSELNADELLDYGYGNSYQMYENYVIVIDKPNDINIIKEIPEEQKENISVMPRRIGLSAGKPSYMISSEYIVGYIDKEHMEIISNPNYKKQEKNNIR